MGHLAQGLGDGHIGYISTLKRYVLEVPLFTLEIN